MTFFIKLRSGLSTDRRYLSAAQDASALDSFEKWTFIQVPGMEGTYIIQVEGMILDDGKERRLLSCDETGIVNLWIVADRSGKQR